MQNLNKIIGLLHEHATTSSVRAESWTVYCNKLEDRMNTFESNYMFSVPFHSS